MYSGAWSFRGIGLILVLASLGSGVHSAEALQQMEIERFFPRQLPRGQSTVITLAAKGLDAIQAVEISPSPGVTVSGTKQTESAQGLTWWELIFDVAKDAATGERTVVLVTPRGRTAPATIIIPSHVPSISELTILSAQSNQATVELRLSVFDEFADLGNAVDVWFTIRCGGQFVAGASKGNVTGRDKRHSVVHAIVRDSNPRASATGKCDFEVRLSDSGGIDSNTLRTTVDFKN